MGLKIINLVIELEDDVPHILAVHLVLTDEFRDHGVVSTESVLHHPLALEDLLFHSFQPSILAPGLLRSLNVPDVEHPSRISMA